jgi:hypothetical protein
MQKRFSSKDAATENLTEEQLAQRTEEEQISLDAAAENPATTIGESSSLAGTKSAEPAEVVEEVVAEVGM